MVTEQEDVFYYLTVMNENYEHPAMPEGAAPGILKGMYQFRKGAASNGPRVQLLGSGTIFMEVDCRRRAAEEGLGRRSRPLVLPQLQRTGARRPGLRALEPAAPDREAARARTSAPAWPRRAAR